MTEPLVCAIMLTRARPAMAARALESFRRQTYANKRLLVWDTGELNRDFEDGQGQVMHFPAEAYRENISIGKLRNEANSKTDSAILIHWDDDDWSHPNRIAEQVALLQTSGADCVGYGSLLCWDSRSRGTHQPDRGEAYLFTHPWPTYALGTSLCYWRKTWEQRPFQDLQKGEDYKFCEGLRMATASDMADDEPRMIVSMHGGNTGNTTDPAAEIARGSKQWRRVPEWDGYCAEVMQLKVKAKR